MRRDRGVMGEAGRWRREEGEGGVMLFKIDH